MLEREEYFEELADEYGVDVYVIKELAEALGENELYDGLVSALEDILYYYY